MVGLLRSRSRQKTMTILFKHVYLYVYDVDHRRCIAPAKLPVISIMHAHYNHLQCNRNGVRTRNVLLAKPPELAALFLKPFLTRLSF